MLEVHFADGRSPLIVEVPSLLTSLTWASDAELVYRTAGRPLGTEPEPTFYVFSVEDGRSRWLAEVEGTVDTVWTGRPGHLSLLMESDQGKALFDLDARSGALDRMPAFDEAFDGLEIYPLFGHSWSAQRQEVALIAWPYDWLEEGVEPTRMNSQWSPLLNEPSIQNFVTTRRDGSRITQRELAQEARRKKPFRLFLLNVAGGCQEVPGSYKAHHPLWSPDGRVLAFMRYEEDGEAVWLARRDELSLSRAGACPPVPHPVMHPPSFLWCKLMDQDAPNAGESAKQGIKPAKWYRLDLSDGVDIDTACGIMQ